MQHKCLLFKKNSKVFLFFHYIYIFFSDLAGADTSDCDSLGKKQTNVAVSTVSIHSEPDMLPFSKDPSGRYIVLYTFIARDENDVSVERGEFVTGRFESYPYIHILF